MPFNDKPLAMSGYLTCCRVLRILLEDDYDRLQLLHSGGLRMLQMSFHTIYLMHHEATACHVTDELQEILGIVAGVLKTVRNKFSDKQSECDTTPRLSLASHRLVIVYRPLLASQRLCARLDG